MTITDLNNHTAILVKDTIYSLNYTLLYILYTTKMCVHT